MFRNVAALIIVDTAIRKSRPITVERTGVPVPNMTA
jgi:hypothetical protein